MRSAALVAAMLVLAGCGDSTNGPSTAEEGETAMELTSSAFDQGEMIPSVYTCDGEDVSPPLTISGIPEDVESLVVIMDDPDAPRGTWDHWVAYDIPVTGEIPARSDEVGTGGTNSWGRTGYGGPCPPSGVHRYFFRVYALDTRLGLPEGAGKEEVRAAVEGHVLGEAELMGRYGR